MVEILFTTKILISDEVNFDSEYRCVNTEVDGLPVCAVSVMHSHYLLGDTVLIKTNAWRDVVRPHFIHRCISCFSVWTLPAVDIIANSLVSGFCEFELDRGFGAHNADRMDGAIREHSCVYFVNVYIYIILDSRDTA